MSPHPQDNQQPGIPQDFLLQQTRMTLHLNLLNANATLHRLAQRAGELTGLEMRILALTEEYLGVAT